MEKITEIAWIQDAQNDLLDPRDGEEPIEYWWDDMRPGEICKLVKDVYERGYRHGQKDITK